MGAGLIFYLKAGKINERLEIKNDIQIFCVDDVGLLIKVLVGDDKYF